MDWGELGWISGGRCVDLGRLEWTLVDLSTFLVESTQIRSESEQTYLESSKVKLNPLSTLEC